MLKRDKSSSGFIAFEALFSLILISTATLWFVQLSQQLNRSVQDQYQETLRWKALYDEVLLEGTYETESFKILSVEAE